MFRTDEYVDFSNRFSEYKQKVTNITGLVDYFSGSTVGVHSVLHIYHNTLHSALVIYDLTIKIGFFSNLRSSYCVYKPIAVSRICLVELRQSYKSIWIRQVNLKMESIIIWNYDKIFIRVWTLFSKVEFSYLICKFECIVIIKLHDERERWKHNEPYDIGNMLQIRFFLTWISFISWIKLIIWSGKTETKPFYIVTYFRCHTVHCVFIFHVHHAALW
jgi:hypothetical protein